MDDSHDMADDIDWMYGVGDRLQHVKTGRFYVVRTLAFDEATATPVYVYSLDSWSNQTEWVRAKDVMEDGRFVYAPKPTEAQKDAEIAQLRADLAAMTEQSESYKAMALSAARRVRDIHTIVCGEDDSLSPREQHEAIVDALRGHHALGPWTAAEADLARRIAGDPCVVSKRWPGGSVEHARVVGEEAERAERSHRTLCGDSAQFLMKKAIPWIAAMTERAEKAERELDEEIEDRRQARDDAARAAALLAVRTMERDARPEISREDARRYVEWRDGFSPHPANVDRLEPVDDALRAHAAGSGAGDRFRARAASADHAEVPVLAAEASEPSPPPTAPPLLEWGPDGPRLSEYERKRLEREAAEASGGVCGTCRGVDVGMAHWTCPACNGTGRKEGTDA